jgi:hypothetical protein
MVFTHCTAHYTNLKSLAGLPYLFRYLTMQYLVAILRHSHNMALNPVHRVATASEIHAASPPIWRLIVTAKADRLKPVVLTF